MKEIIELYRLLQDEKDFQKKYPQFNPRDGKIHILFLSACLNGTGYYRSITPSMELNRSQTHASIITSIHKWNFNKQSLEYDNALDSSESTKLIQWADYVILPTVLTDTTYIAKALQALNPDVQLVMDIDVNIHATPKEHPQYDKITKQQQDQLLKNISEMNLLIGASEGLLDYYDELLEKQYPNSSTFLEYIPNLISAYGYAEVKPLKKNASDRIRIGIIGNASSAMDTLNISDVLKTIQDKYKEKIELILLGWNGISPKGELALQGIQFTYVKSVGFLDYFDALNELALDIALVPLADIPYNTKGKSFVKYLELSVFRIPTVASDLAPLNEVIDSNENGCLASSHEDWVSSIERLISDSSLRERMGSSALKAVWRNYSFTSHTLQIFQEIFI
ncbi:MAG: glycosyltransferase [Ekhidna sp.]